MSNANQYNATVLDAELRAVGLGIAGCSSTGRIDWTKSPSASEKKKAEGVLKAHDPAKLPPRAARCEALRAKRRAGKPLTAQEMQEVLDLLLEV